MDNPVRKLLLDIATAIQHIELFTATIESFDDYEQNLIVRRAVERELEIIGEAMNRLLEVSPGIPISNARRIVDLRNRVIHGYDSVDDALIWGILKRYLPILRHEISMIQSLE